MGMDRILKGIMQYRATVRSNLVKEFERVRDHPEVSFIKYKSENYLISGILFYSQKQSFFPVGDMFIVRNAGNLIPHSTFFATENTSTEPAALELGCIINEIQHVIVCGHSDCKVSANKCTKYV
jgi:carbonic anhydrase